MMIYWTASKSPKAEDANPQGFVMASNTGRAGFRPIKWDEVRAHLYREWSPLFGPVDVAA